jgi:FkbM family methyltransferase
MPIWWAKGHGDFDISGQKLRFVDVAEPPHDWWARIAYRREYEVEVGQFLAEHLHPGDVFFDVGAYMGQYSLMAARLGAKAFTFEPDPRSQSLCERNAGLNGLEIVLVRAAVGDMAGTTTLTSAHLGRATSRPDGSSSGITVPVVTLDSFCEEHQVWPDVIKIDIEGGEVAALGDTATKTLEHARAIVIEVHEPDITARGGDPQVLLQRLGHNRRRIDLESRWRGNYNVAFVRG